jgi:hypothetical protein
VDEDARYEAVVSALEAGAIPRDKPLKTWAGAGTGQTCAVCGARLTEGDIEYELEFASGRLIIVDRRCHAIWSEERTKA